MEKIILTTLGEKIKEVRKKEFLYIPEIKHIISRKKLF